MTTRDKLILESKAWAEEMKQVDQRLFERLTKAHQPNIIWICSVDSLVPVREVTNMDLGEVIVYRNIANLINPDDPGTMAVLEDSLAMYDIDLIMICGYSHCTGVRDVLQGCDDRPTVKQWLAPLQELYDAHRDNLDSLGFEEKSKQLSQLNIRLQIDNLSKTSAVQRAWSKNKGPMLLGWYFDLGKGTFTELCKVEPVGIPVVESVG